MPLNLLAALAAAVAYGSATILQALGVRSLATVPEGAPLLRRAMAGRLYGAGLVLDGIGFCASIVALRQLPLFLVESVVASSVAVTAILARFVLHLVLSRAEVEALITVGVGLVLLAVSADGRPPQNVPGTAQLGTLLACVPVIVVGALSVRDSNRTRSAPLLAVTAGLGFGIVGIAARVLPLRDHWWQLADEPATWAIVTGGIVAVVAYGFALDRGRTTSVAAITFSVETVVPAAIGLLALGDAVRAGFWPSAAIGFMLTLGGCITLAGRSEAEVA